MKWIIITMLVLLSPSGRSSEAPISLAFDEAPVERVLQALADYQQLNLMVAPGVEGTLSLRLKEVSWQQALKLITRMAKLTIETEGNVMLVYPESWQLEQQQRVTLRSEQQQLTLPLETRSLTLQYADATTVNNSLLSQQAKLMTPRGSATVDTRTNALLLRDTAAALQQTVQWVQALDVPLEQIELAAHIVTISEENLRELGVSWGMSSEEQITRALRTSQLGIDLGVSKPTFTAGFHLARLDGRLLDLELSALERENQIEIIASPRLFTSHQQPASIKQGTEIPYEVSSGSNGATTIEFKEAVLGMEVTPSVQPNGRIMLKLRISQNVPGRNLHSGEIEVLTIDKQEIETQISLKDGQTLALGGIFQQQNSTGRDKVPLLGDIPLLGALFRHDVRQQKRRELVIFITPRLIRDE
ncbi:DNA uptake porin HofQ [Erwiniaceae bacterium BAC15a-03b]|uniref:DNA uptake porin HofQ n=1 Tax=Winslowiella arboricola TaxID=2978220 RepID=A0A9J6PTX0_9GAMM|nr:DNA uptake porin HofQ [Winslowiella arboricola]MCU5771857.1 DNA uptake porin HofQ [Winslowiella arboricola]MCU5777487.1 DNA uptake porin HofQ [Winslowiella arboricola]